MLKKDPQKGNKNKENYHQSPSQAKGAGVPEGLIYRSTSTIYHRLFHDGKVLVHHTNITKMVRTKKFAWVEPKLTTLDFISNEFGCNAVCNFYLTPPIVTENFAMIFPV